MHHHNSKRNKLIRIIAVYTTMTVITAAVVTFIVLVVLGFRFDASKNQIEQYAFLQFNSSPTGAMVAVDGNVVSGQTPNKTSVPEGSHEVVIWKDGYETWRKTLYVKSGTLTWLNYILMIPNKLSVEQSATYDSIYMSLASPNGKYMAAQQNEDKPVFDLSDISSDTVKTVQLTMPKKDYSEAYTSSVKHVFRIAQWDLGERYLLIKHSYNDNVEWLVMDTQDAENTKNITKLFDLTFTDIKFSGSGGNILFGLESGNIRKLDINAGTVSKILLSKSQQFSLFDQNIITYVADGDTAGSRFVGLYRDGDEKPYVVKNVSSDSSVPVRVVSTHYFNQDYVAVSEGKNVDIYSGNYSNSILGATSSIKLIKSFVAADNVQTLTFSPSGQYLLAQSGAYFSSYDLEYQNLVSSTVDSTGSASPLRWLNNSYVWSDNGSNLNIREFDGANPRTINPVVIGQDAVMTHSGSYMYSISKNDAGGFQLQRVRLIAP